MFKTENLRNDHDNLCTTISISGLGMVNVINNNIIIHEFIGIRRLGENHKHYTNM